MKIKILFTGLTGRTGPYLIASIENEPEKLEGYELSAIVRESSNTSAIDASSLHIQKHVGDLTDEKYLESILPSVDTVVHIAGIHWSVPVVRAATKCGVRRMIAVHTTGVYSKYKSAGEEYRSIDAAVEAMCQEAGTILTILRPTMIYGGLDDMNVCRFIHLVDRFPRIPVVSGGKFRLQPVNRRDLGKAYFQVLTNPENTAGKQYVLSGEAPVELRSMLTQIAGMLGEPKKFFSIPFCMAFLGAFVLFVLTLGRIDLREKVQRLVENRDYPHDAASLDFGYQPMPLMEGLKLEVEEYLAAKQ